MTLWLNEQLHEGQQAGEGNGLLCARWLESSEGRASSALHGFGVRKSLSQASASSRRKGSAHGASRSDVGMVVLSAQRGESALK